MKQYYLSSLCSAFLVPGMGQILNRHVKKGLALMGFVFLLLIAAVWEFLKCIEPLLDPPAFRENGFAGILHRINIPRSSNLALIAILFAAFWLYSIFDAFFYGMKIEKQKKEERVP